MTVAAMYTAATGAYGAQKRIENEANNLANTDTAGFKPFAISNSDIAYSVNQAPGAPSGDYIKPTGVYYGIGTKVQGVYPIFTQGSAKQTDDQHHLMIDGLKGFFKIMKGDEEYYTRDGTFTMNAERKLVTQQGYIVGDGIEFSPDGAGNITISTSGKVAAGGVAVGDIKLYAFANLAGLQPMGDNLYKDTEASGKATEGVPSEDGFASLKQNYLEESTSNALRSMVTLVEAQRKYQFNANVIKTASEIMDSDARLSRS